MVLKIVKQDQTMNSVLSGFSDRPDPLDFDSNAGVQIPMFVFDRSALAVLLPLALLVAVVAFSSRSGHHPPQAEAHAAQQDQAVAANLLSR
jgi:hypothetical protein